MTKDQAKAVYTAAWASYVICADSKTRRALEFVMDDAQSHITLRLGPEWQAFIDTLPGYRAFWNNFKIEAESMIECLKRKAGL